MEDIAKALLLAKITIEKYAAELKYDIRETIGTELVAHPQAKEFGPKLFALGALMVAVVHTVKPDDWNVHVNDQIAKFPETDLQSFARRLWERITMMATRNYGFGTKVLVKTVAALDEPYGDAERFEQIKQEALASPPLFPSLAAA